METLEDPIEVEVRFGMHGMRPLWFFWQGRRRIIQTMTSTWQERDGMLVHRCFSVSDGEACYELRFEVRSLRWHLTKIAWQG